MTTKPATPLEEVQALGYESIEQYEQIQSRRKVRDAAEDAEIVAWKALNESQHYYHENIRLKDERAELVAALRLAADLAALGAGRPLAPGLVALELGAHGSLRAGAIAELLSLGTGLG